MLHILGSLAADDPQAERCVRLIGALGGRLRHSLVAIDGDFSGLAAIAKGISAERLPTFPALGGLPLPGRLQRIAQAMVDYHLILTYGRGGIRAALAHTAFGEVHALPPLIHHEDGSDESTAHRQGLRSKWLRRVGLGKSAGLVVPTETMEACALVEWQQPMGRVKLIPDGADAPPRRKGKSNGIGRLLKHPGEVWIGCFARPDATQALTALMKRLRRIDESCHLVIVGNLPGRAELEAAVTQLALDHRVHFLHPLPDRADAIALFDILAAPGGAEPLPVSLVEAVAAGKPVIGLDPVESGALLSPENAALGEDSLQRLAGDAYLRSTIGAANRERALAERGEQAMIASYRRLYASAMGRDSL